MLRVRFSFFSFTHWPPTDFYPFSLHDALPISKGVEELQAAPLSPGRVRHEGGGRHALTSHDPGLVPALDSMVEPTARGDPQSPLRWTCKSARTLAAELMARNHSVSHTQVTQLLREGGY